MRWTIISDESGHDYLCPADRAEEAEAVLEAIEEYWRTWGVGQRNGDPPRNPDYLIRLEGGRLTFVDPLVDGESPR